MTKTPMTFNGSLALKAELNTLKNVTRKRIIEDIATAREHGDLKENAEYHAAKEEQAFAEGRIKEIEGKIANAQIIDVSKMENTGRCIFGTTVKLLNLDDDSEIIYQIVGADEADIAQNKISCYSPIANALIGKEEGDEVIVKAPKGDIEYEILEVLYL